MGLPSARTKLSTIKVWHININTISTDRARELLIENPNYFASEPDDESKLRKLQTYLELLIGARTEFRVTNPSRARVILPATQDRKSQ